MLKGSWALSTKRGALTFRQGWVPLTRGRSCACAGLGGEWGGGRDHRCPELSGTGGKPRPLGGSCPCASREAGGTPTPEADHKAGQAQGHQRGPACSRPRARRKPALPSPKLPPRTKGEVNRQEAKAGLAVQMGAATAGPSGTQQASPRPGRPEAQLEAKRPPPGHSGQRALSAHYPAERRNQGHRARLEPQSLVTRPRYTLSPSSLQTALTRGASCRGPAQKGCRWWRAALPPPCPAPQRERWAKAQDAQLDPVLLPQGPRGLRPSVTGTTAPRAPGRPAGRQLDRKTRRARIWGEPES